MAVPSLAPADSPPAGPAPAVSRAAQLTVKYGLAAVILTLPLEFTATYTWQPLARWALAVTGIAFAYLVVTRRRDVLWPRSASAIVLACFLAFTLGSWLLTRAPGSLKPLLDITLYPVAALLMLNVVRTEDDQRRAWIALLASGLMVAALGAILFTAGWTIWTPNPAVANRMNITFADPNITARFLTLCGSAAVLMFAARRGPAWLAVACALACAGVLPLTYSRSGLALFIVSVVLAAVASLRRKRAFTIAAVTLLVFAISTGVNPVTRDRAEGAALVLETMVTGTAHNISTPGAGPGGKDAFALEDNRKYLIAAGVNMFADHPIAGVGFGGYQHQLLTAYRSYLPNAPNPDTVSHTAFVTVAAEEGVIGLAVLVAFLIWLGAEGWRQRRSVWVQVPMVLIVPIVLYSQFEGRFLEEPYLWLCLALIYAAFQLRRPVPVRPYAAPEASSRRLPK